MALVFPRALPTHSAGEQRFEIERVDYDSPEVGGATGSVQAGFPRWMNTIDLTAMSEARSEEWRAFVRSLRGSSRAVYGRDLIRGLPLAYPGGFDGMTRAGGGAFDGTATGWSVNGDRDVLTLTGLPVGLQISPGDHCGFSWDTDKRDLTSAVEAATADGSGVATFTIEPALWSGVDAGAVATLLNPECRMRLVPGDSQLGSVGLNRYVEASLTFLQERVA